VCVGIDIDIDKDIHHCIVSCFWFFYDDGALTVPTLAGRITRPLRM
jgi:hypothetical protein